MKLGTRANYILKRYDVGDVIWHFLRPEYHVHRTPAKDAFRYGHVVVLDYLVSCGAKIDFYDILAACKAGKYQIFKYLYPRYPYFRKIIHDRGVMFFKFMCEMGHIEIVKFLVSCGAADIHIHMCVPLRIAYANGHDDIVKYLMSCGAVWHYTVNAALEWSIRNNYVAGVKDTLYRNANTLSREDIRDLMNYTTSDEIIKLLKLKLDYA